MDILHLVDRLEEVVKGSSRLLFGNIRLVDERQIWPLLDQMRISIPDEVRRAERIIREKERVLAQAHEEAERITTLARSEAAQLTAEHSIIQAAETRVAGIRERAEREIQTVRAEADEYAFNTLCNLEQELKRALTVIENGIQALEVRDSSGSPPPSRKHPPSEP
ncbi:MAG: ATP synthase F0 subunit B [Chloroflexi bacterium]|nr:ATP synthase F0 subunit B [Chloroflexota bacterium]